MTASPPLGPEALALRARAELARLVGFDTTSRGSNLRLIEYVEGELGKLGASHRRVPNKDGSKSNLIASFGPTAPGGVVLSGHTDVVPVDGQPWTTDPWTVTERDGRLYGRGTCDMKGFLALCLAAAPEFASGRLKTPVHFAFSYDEEVGCLGAPDMIEVIRTELPKPSLVIVGEPTNMEAVCGHKGIATYVVTVTGHEAHSSLTHLGLSANMAAIKLLAMLSELSEGLAREAGDCLFHPKGASLTVGLIHGGTAVNILARECCFTFDLRTPPGMEPNAILQPFLLACERMDRELKTRFSEAGVVVEPRSRTPAFAPEKDGAAEAFARRLAGDNGPARVVPYAAEAGQFQQAGFSTVICGPGSIDQAHQPDEYLEVSQLQRGAAFMARLVEALS